MIKLELYYIEIRGYNFIVGENYLREFCNIEAEGIETDDTIEWVKGQANKFKKNYLF